MNPSIISFSRSFACTLVHALPVVAFIAATALADGVGDPTRPTAAMADALKVRAASTAAMALKALVVGDDDNGVAVVGASSSPVRSGSSLVCEVGGVQVQMSVRSVTAKGVEIVQQSGEPLFLGGSFTPLERPAAKTPEFIHHLEANSMPIGQLLRLISDQSGVNVSSSDSVASKTVSIFLRNVSAETAIEEICRTTGLWYRREGESGVMRVTTMDEYADNLGSFREERTEMFTLLYPNVIEVAAAIYGIYPDRTLLSLGEEEFDEDEEYDLSRRFRRFKVLEDNGGSTFLGMEAPDASSSGGTRGGSGQFSFSRGTGLSRLAQWDQISSRMRRRGVYGGDRAGLSASEAKQLDGARTAGDTNRYDAIRAQTTLTAANIFVSVSRRNNILVVRTSDMRVMDEIRTLVKKLDVPTPMVLMEVKVLELTLDDTFEAGVKWTLTDVDRGNGVSTHALGHDGDAIRNLVAQTLSSTQNRMDPTFAFAAVSDHLRTDIELMQRDGKVRTLATPVLLTANNEVSRIFSGKEYPLVSGWSKADTTATEGVVVQGQMTVQIEKKDVGTMLLITPNINADKTVTLHLLQENSSIADQKVSIPVDGGSGESKEIEYVESRSLVGTFVAKDGMAVMAGGLISERNSEEYWRVPFLGSIPGLGWLFRGTELVKRRTELVVLIRPHVISTPVEGGRISSELMEKLSAHPARDGRPSMGVMKSKDEKK